jgi:hypothetical protein
MDLIVAGDRFLPWAKDRALAMLQWASEAANEYIVRKG